MLELLLKYGIKVQESVEMASLKRWLDQRRNPWKKPFYDAYRDFRRDNAAARLTDHSHLPEKPVVLDFGGYVGDWTETVLSARPKAQLHVFEPHPRFAESLRERFDGLPNVRIHACALGAVNGSLDLSDADDASSALNGTAHTIKAPIVSVSEFFEAHEIESFDLAKINIEGGEYDLLPALVDSGVLRRIDCLLIQFHLFQPEFLETRKTIRDQLAKTHRCTWEYPFVWEEWRKYHDPEDACCSSISRTVL